MSMRVLGIETSCDETSAAVVVDGREVRSNVVYSQIAHHQPYGGVVPEVASRCHLERLPGILREAMAAAGAEGPDLDAVAVTCGPGLASALLVGVTAAKAIALRLNRPLIGVNHLAGHLYSILLSSDDPPSWMRRRGLILLVSGGHTSLVEMNPGPVFRMIGTTLDDAAGEALDKGAKLMGLGYPGGPEIERAAEGGDPEWIDFPRGRTLSAGAAPCDLDPALCFSFSGLKTSLRYFLRDHPEAARGETLRHLAASYQEAVADALARRLERAAGIVKPEFIACAGGVARNRRLRARLDAVADRMGLPLRLARMEFCTDNAAMIAGAAGAGLGRIADPVSSLDIRPVFPLGV
jgi:N6-L-threonylcarbamoyladenine synthase